ncbi:MAG: MBL fold metallo-hydrolase [Akkermansiaceae bacterium]|nr:MBL fold metallo-hydrolase [Akkermansiaceae bacterium]
MLEDDFTYVIRKAFKGLAMAPTEAARLAGLPENQVLAFSRGEFSADVARQLAPILGLAPDALANHYGYQPRPLALQEIQRIEMSFDDERVNAWLIKTDDATILFDTGHLPHDCQDAVSQLGISKIDQIFITHEHPDHIGGISSFLKKEIALYGSNIPGSAQIAPGETIDSGSLTVRACDLSGHAVPALGYHLQGLSLPILVAGDALFAGSMGGCYTTERYQLALRSLKSVLTPLPDQTIILPGHGPATSLGEERLRNPFLAF